MMIIVRKSTAPSIEDRLGLPPVEENSWIEQGIEKKADRATEADEQEKAPGFETAGQPTKTGNAVDEARSGLAELL
jgi:hypothetical protein